MSPLKIKLLADAVRIQMRREKITVEEAVARYTISDEDKAAVLAALC